jgi:arsenite methyltransferase
MLKACCAAAYSSDAARFLLGESFHPGGAALTSRLAQALRVGPRDTVVDVASGPGKSALQLTRETGCDVVGVELSPALVAEAGQAAKAAGLGGSVRFLQGDAEALPLPDASADGVLCECALCIFPDKERAVQEVARVLRPGARLALSDLTAVRERLPRELSSLEARVACLGDARSLAETEALLGQAGLIVELAESHDRALVELLDRIEARRWVARSLVGDVAEHGLSLLALVRSAVGEGALGYCIVVARQP